MVKTPYFHCMGYSFDPWSRNLKSHILHYVAKKKEKERKENRKHYNKTRSKNEGNRKLPLANSTVISVAGKLH